MRLPLEMLLIVVALAMHIRGLPYRELSPQLQTQGELVWYGDNSASQVQSNVYPNYKTNIIPEQIGQTPFKWDQLQQNTFEGYEKHVPSELQKQHNSDYIYQSDPTLLQPYPSVVDDFTISCSGENKVCVAKSLCINGYVHPLKQGFIRPGQVQECKLSHEVCCTVRHEFDNSPYNNDQINTVLKNNQYPEPTLENDQKYVPYGENNQADVIELRPPSRNYAKLQSVTNEAYPIKSVNLPRGDIQSTEEVPINYNQIPSDTNQQEQYQTGSVSASESVFPPLKKSSPSDANSVVFQFPVQLGCAAALLCVEEQYCTLEGVINPEPVALTSTQLLRRVPLSNCRNPETGVVGKCCRDPNYVDPWPAGNLPANYSGGFDEQGFPTFLNIAKVPPPKKPVTQPPVKIIPKPPIKMPPPVHEQVQPTNVAPLVPDNSDIIPIPTQIPIMSSSTSAPFTKNPYDAAFSNQPDAISILPQLPNNPCGVRNYGQRPSGFKQTDAAFGEIPWQAMILWSEERKILCSGALVASDIVLTAASCINRFAPNELSVKLGEWKLGYELKHEEPLSFEIINVRTIKYHPRYVEGLSSNDTAILVLVHPATFNLHINTLCLPEYPEYQVQETSQCIVTGWGKSILQAHYAGAIMHMVDVDFLSRDICQNRVLGAESHINIAHNIICGKAHKQNNMCQADIGSPLACYDSKGTYHIAGIYSQDTGCLPTNQVATFTPIDVAWVKENMHTETKIDIAQTNINDSYDYRKSNLPAGNEYLPPV
ncbi:uncharacterized protein [Linepithema humile]|nr:PREDICTED: uncharacterized protein LOC105679414 [Linepithema humile]